MSKTYLYRPVLNGFLLVFCFCFKASVLRSVMSCSAVTSLCRPSGISLISLGMTASYSRGNVIDDRSCVAIVARVRWSHVVSCSLVCLNNKTMWVTLSYTSQPKLSSLKLMLISTGGVEHILPKVSKVLQALTWPLQCMCLLIWSR